MNARSVGPVIIGLMVMLLLGLLVVPMLVVGGSSLLFFGGTGGSCGSSTANTQQPAASKEAANSIPANYLKWFQRVGLQYNVPWTILAGIGEVESDDGRTTLPGVNSGANAFGAAGPMQIGIEGASGDAWAVVATAEDGIEPPSVYDPADAIAGAAKYLVMHGVQQDATTAIFAYNHADWYVQEVLSWASTYATGGFTVAEANQSGTTVTTGSASQKCTEQSELDSFTAPNVTVSEAVNYAEAQIGKPYLWGGTGPAAYDCSGLVMMAYRSAGVNIARTSQVQWTTLPHVAAANVQTGDLVFFAGSDGTPTSPGHVGLVIGKNLMIEAYATGFNIRVSSFGLASSPGGDNTVVGYAQPWPDNATSGSGSGTAAAAAG